MLVIRFMLTSDEGAAELKIRVRNDINHISRMTHIGSRSSNSEEPLVPARFGGIRILGIDSKLFGPEEVGSVDDYTVNINEIK
jgi:hypothetical protein